MCLKKRIFFTVFAIYFVDKKYEVNSWIDIGIKVNISDIYFICRISILYHITYWTLNIYFTLYSAILISAVRSWPQNTSEIKLSQKLPVIRYLRKKCLQIGKKTISTFRIPALFLLHFMKTMLPMLKWCSWIISENVFSSSSFWFLKKGCPVTMCIHVYHIEQWYFSSTCSSKFWKINGQKFWSPRYSWNIVENGV